jgi:hypothetical protein
MPDQAKIGLDNQAFRGRLRQSPLIGNRVKEHVEAFRSGIGANTSWNSNGNPAAMTMTLAGVEPQPQQPTLAEPTHQSQPHTKTGNPATKAQIMLGVGLLSMAVIAFIWGVTVSLQASRTNRASAAQMQAVLQQLEDQPAAK